MRRVLGPKAQDEWLNISMMIGWCLYRAQAGEFTSLQRLWNAKEMETAGRLRAWGVPRYVTPALLGQPLGSPPDDFFEVLGQWTRNEKVVLEQQCNPLEEGRFYDRGRSADNLYGNGEEPYSLKENASGPLGVKIASGQNGDFGPEPQGDDLGVEGPKRAGDSRKRPRETEEDTPEDNRDQSNQNLGEASERTGNSRKRPRETEENTSEGIDGLGGFDDFGYREQRNPTLGERSERTGNSRKRPRETEENTLEGIDGLGGFENFGYREQSNDTQAEGSGSVRKGTQNPYDPDKMLHLKH
ncbi:hypothetical protein F52700_10834 [Fusarium sp. NRRL 52700]|nr:hypothetical protein F52700_10834 [Fusarium sp. NRRL 52700]